MKNAFLKKLMALILIGVMVLGVVACGSDKKDADTEDKDSAEESEVVLDEDDAEDAEDADAEDADAEDADADEEDAEVDAEATEDTVVTSETPLVIGTYTLDGKFTDNNLFRNYIISKENANGVIYWILFWGVPRNLERYITFNER